MVTDIERSYKGTNFAAIAVVVMAVMVVAMMMFANIKDTADDGPLAPRLEMHAR